MHPDSQDTPVSAGSPSPSPGSPAAAAGDALRGECLRVLSQLGFHDQARNTQLLEKHAYNIPRVVQELLS